MSRTFPSNILCPVDFSQMSGAALRFAAQLSGASGAQISALHTYWFETPPYFTSKLADDLKRQFQEAAGEARTALSRFVEQAGIPDARLVIEEGDAASHILRTAEDSAADLIVMGTHGRRGVERFMMGSVAERVLRTSAIPVLTVRDTAPAKIENILCPVNNSPASKEALSRAARLASLLSAQLTVVHIEEDTPESRIEDPCAWIEGQAPQCVVKELRRSGNPAEEILTLARESGAGLLVIGATHQAFFDSTVIGSTTVRVVRHAPCPVLTVPHV